MGRAERSVNMQGSVVYRVVGNDERRHFLRENRYLLEEGLLFPRLLRPCGDKHWRRNSEFNGGLLR